MNWDHRMVRGDEDMIVFMEVYYNDAGKPYACNAPFMMGDDTTDMLQLVSRLQAAAELPVLEACSLFSTAPPCRTMTKPPAP